MLAIYVTDTSNTINNTPYKVTQLNLLTEICYKILWDTGWEEAIGKQHKQREVCRVYFQMCVWLAVKQFSLTFLNKHNNLFIKIVL